MKIAIPVADGKLCPHFGHCEEFYIFDIDKAGCKIIACDRQVPPPHEPGLLPRWLHGMEVTHVIAGGMGARAQGLFQAAGVKVVVGAPAVDAEEVIKAYLENTLVTGDNACDH
ncbi:MAG: NifB/NifX family molybdenum-iron cluster-binding protein [bacterium]|jgi:ATP-binding protein involved in chromosome partitioning|nr:NifB/NifX family molybdenum-iron cluster-binding protein [bacterium]MDD3805731.1 NifB/NifX family molybdenum-iron cluster-binding protein [bacterium]MDD4153739.1 NifB/NifX family molybdenum-iron cluster-binding protein [bacterium]MDD4557523.1 NifB/NifX family molybdenum-iron cluster-binding protein [bacterium]